MNSSPDIPIYGYIHFPAGSGGNHVRWLLFLDSTFRSDLCDNTVEAKLNFIKNNVYNSIRSWQNWLTFEWKFRNKLDHVVSPSHNHHVELDNNHKELFLTVNDPYPFLTHYRHINLGSNSQTIETLVDNFKNVWQKELEWVKESTIGILNKKIIYADTLHDRILTKDFYQTIIDYYQIDNNYEYACELQEMYYQCRLNSQKDFYNYFTSRDFSNYLNNLNKQIKQNILTQQY